MNNITIDTTMPIVVSIENKPVRITNIYCTDPIPPIDPMEIDLKRIFGESNSIHNQSQISFANGSIAQINYYSDCTERIGNMKVYEKVPSGPCRLYLFAILHVDKPQTVLMSIDGRSRAKCWIDNTLIFNSQSDNYRSHSIIYQLPQGNSNIIMEVDPVDRYSIISPRISKFDTDIPSLRGEIIKDYLEYTSLNKYSLLYLNTDLSEKPVFSFVIIPHDFFHIPLNALFMVKLYNEDMDLLSQLECKSLMNIHLDLKEWSRSPVIYFEIECISHDVHYSGPVIELVLNDMNQICSEIYSRYQLQKQSLNDLQKVNIEARIASIRAGENIRQYILEINDLLSEWSQSEFLKQFSSHTRCVYFHSQLDGNLEHLQLTLPENECEKYPILLFLNTKRYDYTPDNFCLICKRNQAAIAQVSLKGVTTGGYIGEPSVFEALEIIKSIISVDDERIYLAGISNGGYASWILAENHPHLFAGIAPMFCSPYSPHLCNLYNVDILNLAGDNDLLIHDGGYQPTEYFQQLNKNNYQFHIMEETDHNTDYEIRYSNWLYDKIFAMRKNPYPSKVMFKANRYKHTRTNYVASIDFDEDMGGEMSLIIESNAVKIDTLHIKNFKLDLPDKLSDKINIISVNDQYFEGDYYTKRDISFNISTAGNVTVNTQITQNNTLKGIGLLDVYLGPMEIVVPETYYDENVKLIINRVAKQFSNPSTNGVETKLYVEYPIIESPAYKPNKGCNRVLIGTSSCPNSDLNNILPKSQIQLLDQGYKYQEKFRTCNYSIMLALPRASASDGTDLLIYCNNIKQMQANIFLRNLVLPSFINGIHPFLNAQVLICSDRGFERIYNLGDPLQKRIPNGDWIKIED